MRRLLLNSVFLVLFLQVRAQDIKYSLPQSMPYGVTKASVLGMCSAGILVREHGRQDNWIECYDEQMTQKWRKQLIITEKSADIEEVFLCGDSLVVFYTTYAHGKYILKANLYSSNLYLQKNAYSIDTLPSLFSNENLELNYIQSFDKRKMMAFYVSSDFQNNRKIFYCIVNNTLDRLDRSAFIFKPMKNPEVLDGVIADNFTAYFVLGDKQGGDNNNDYQYTELGIQSVGADGKARYISNSADGKLFASPETKIDLANKRIVMSGLYADKAGVEANGTFYWRAALNDTTILARQMIPFTPAFISYLSGNPTPKKSDGFYNYKVTDVIVKRDGGVLLITESQLQNSETVGGSSYGGFGVSPMMVVTYYHNNDIVVFSLDSTGTGQWYQVLRKKQSSDNDGGYYLSYGMMIGPLSIYFMYNDQLNTENTLSCYVVDATGTSKREELINIDRKNLYPIPKGAKQIGLKNYALPSLRKGYFQLIDINF